MYKVEISNAGDSVFKVASKDYAFSIDTKGNGVTPPDTLLASIGSCIGVYLKKYAEGTHIELRDFIVTVESDFVKEDSSYFFKRIQVRIDLKGVALDERRKAALLAFVRNCPVHATLKRDPQIEIAIG